MWIRFIANTPENRLGDVVDVGEVEAKEKIEKGVAVARETVTATEKPVVEEGVIVHDEEEAPRIVVQVRQKKRRII